VKLLPGPLASGWTLETHEPGARLRLSLSGERLSNELKRRAAVLPLPLLFSTLLVLWSWNSDWGLKLVAWPVVLALMGVFVAGVFALSRTLRRRREGVFFELDRTNQKVRGVLEADFYHRSIEAPFSQLESLELKVHEGPQGAWATLRPKLKDGRVLQAPEARAETAAAAKEKLQPLKDAADDLIR